MCLRSKNSFSFAPFGSSLLLSSSVLLYLFLFALSAHSVPALRAEEAPSGIAWDVRGRWQAEGKGALILAGDSIQPGSLLQPDEGAAYHSITILLPDGQSILYECFTAEDCSRGFRVPSLYRTPEPLAVDSLTRIGATLAGGHNDLSAGSTNQRASRLPRDEAVAVLGPDNRVHVEGLAARLSNGRYTYDLRPLNRAHPREPHLVFDKNGPSITLALPSSGLYVLTIIDDLNTPRIDLFLAAVEPAQAAGFEKSYRDAKALMKNWNDEYQSWPIHDFQRAYLESLMLSVNVLPTDRRVNAASKVASPAELPGRLDDAAKNRTDVTAEPAFSPGPGLFDKDIAVTLQCNTPGATMHFTVDGSQPVASSPVYRAPIMVKGTELSIKSFASVTGRKDSAVVTGIFRIQE